MAYADFREDLAEAAENGPAAVEALQKAKADSEADNADYYIALANYWLAQSKSIVISTKPAEQNDFTVADQETGAPVGSVSTEGAIDPELAQKAPKLLAEALRRFPSRIDIALGLAYCLAQESDWKACGTSLEALLTLYQSAPDGFQGKTGRSIPPAEAADVIKGACFDRALDAYESEDPEAEMVGNQIAERALEVFPQDVRLLNLLFAFSARNGDSVAATQWLEQAHAIAPEDPIVALNLAEQYLAAGKNTQARALAEQVVAAGREFREDAQALIERSK